MKSNKQNIMEQPDLGPYRLLFRLLNFLLGIVGKGLSMRCINQMRHMHIALSTFTNGVSLHP